MIKRGKRKLFGGFMALILLASAWSSVAFAYTAENLFGSLTGNAYADNTTYELGTKFWSDVPGSITDVRVYGVTGESGNHTVRIWNNVTGTVVGGPYTFNFTGSNSWATYTLPSSISIKANTFYTVSVSTGTDSTKYYAANSGNVSSRGNNGSHLFWPANAGVYSTTAGALPTSTYGGNNYLRDVVFVPSSGGSVTLNCSSTPSSCGYPDATNTGVPAGTVLTASSSINITTNGTVIDAKDVTGDIYIDADNVTIKNTRVTKSGGSGIAIADGSQNVTIQDVEVRGTNATTGRLDFGIRDNTQFGQEVKIYRANIYYMENGVHGVSTLLQDSYLHDFGYVTGDHNDGFEMEGGYGATVKHNTIFMNLAQTGAVYLSSYYTAITGATVENNLLAGGGYTIYGGGGSAGISSNVKIFNNRISRVYYSTGGYWGPLAYYDDAGSGNEFYGNYWDDTGIPVQ